MSINQNFSILDSQAAHLGITYRNQCFANSIDCIAR